MENFENCYEILLYSIISQVKIMSNMTNYEKIRSLYEFIQEIHDSDYNWCFDTFRFKEIPKQVTNKFYKEVYENFCIEDK